MPPRDNDSVLEAVHELVHLARARMRHIMATDEDLDINPMEGRTVGFFLRHPGATLTDLALHSGRDKGQLARLVAGLKQRGLLSTQQDSDDRRMVRLYATEAAQQHHAQLMQKRQQVAALAAEGLSAEERRQLLALLARMQTNLRPAPCTD